MVKTICNVCEITLDAKNIDWAKEHLKEFPTHRSYTNLVK